MSNTLTARDGDIEFLAGYLRLVWEWGRDGEIHPFDIMASDLLRILDGYTAPPSPNDPAGPNPPPARIKITAKPRRRSAEGYQPIGRTSGQRGLPPDQGSGGRPRNV